MQEARNTLNAATKRSGLDKWKYNGENQHITTEHSSKYNINL
jgi:hypothetical protein